MEPTNPWDDYADEYDQWLSRREPGAVVDTAFPDRLLDLLGDLEGRAVLDAGCGQGYLSRMLAARGARVTGTISRPGSSARLATRTPIPSSTTAWAISVVRCRNWKAIST